MTPSSETVSWAKILARRVAAAFPHLQDDLEGAAMYGLAKAARSYPGPDDQDQLRAYAYRAVMNSVIDEIRAYHPVNRRRGKGICFEPLTDVPINETDLTEWWDFREYCSKQLPCFERQLFLTIYGPTYYTPCEEAAQSCNVSRSAAFRLQYSFRRTLRPFCEEQVA